MDRESILVADAFQDVLSAVTTRLQSDGFKRVGSKYVRSESFGSLIILLQKSRKSTSDHVFFTAEMAIRHVRVASVLDTLGFTSIAEAQYRQRVGLLLSPPRDLWWEISPAINVNLLASSVSTVIKDYAVQELLRYQTSESLCELWRSGKSPGLTDTQRVICLAVLLKELGRESELNFLEESSAKLGQPSQVRLLRSFFDGLRKGRP